MYDFPEVVTASRRFFREHGLGTWAKAIPRLPTPARDVELVLEQAHRSGFTEAFAFPPFTLQWESLDQVLDSCARQPAAQLPDNLQYREPFLADDWTRVANGRILQRRDDLGERSAGPYVLVFASRPLTNCWGKTGKQIAEQFHARSWHGLTVPEYLVLQRHFAERFGDHRFFAEPEDPTGHWLWLIDSMTADACSVAFGSGRGINLQATGINNRESRRAGIAGVLIPLEPTSRVP